jgi:hypothetical protein
MICGAGSLEVYVRRLKMPDYTNEELTALSLHCVWPFF